MSLTQAMQLWEREEEEELRRRVEWTDTRRQVAAFDLWGDRPHTIGVGETTHEYAVDVQERNQVVSGSRARRVLARQERHRRRGTDLNQVPEGRDVHEWREERNPPLRS